MSKTRYYYHSCLLLGCSFRLNSSTNKRMIECLSVNWPSGLRRQFKALVRKGVGSNPTLANSFFGLSPTPAFRLSCKVHAMLSPVMLGCCFSQTVAPTTEYCLLATCSTADDSTYFWCQPLSKSRCCTSRLFTAVRYYRLRLHWLNKTQHIDPSTIRINNVTVRIHRLIGRTDTWKAIWLAV